MRSQRKGKTPTNVVVPPDGHRRLSREPVRLRLIATGDLCPIRRVKDLLVRRRTEVLLNGFSDLFQKADVTVVNLEAPLCDRGSAIPKSGPTFRAPRSIASVLAEIGVDVCCLANNHIRDRGDAALLQTCRTLTEARLAHLGAGTDAESAAAPLWLRRRGLRLALLNFAEGEFARSDGGVGAGGLDSFANLRAVTAAAGRADVTIVFLHAGNEHLLFPSPRMQVRCRRFIEAGAAAVIAHHPHVPQGVEFWRGRPIAYSLGNFLFDWPRREPDTETAFVLELGLGRSGVADMTLHPCRKSAAGGVERLTGAERSAYLRLLSDMSRPLADSRRMSAMWDEQCRRLWRRRYADPLKRIEHLLGGDPPKARKAALTLQNLIQCEAHAETLIHALKLLVAGRMESRPAVRRRLDRLTIRLRAFALNAAERT